MVDGCKRYSNRQEQKKYFKVDWASSHVRDHQCLREFTNGGAGMKFMTRTVDRARMHRKKIKQSRHTWATGSRKNPTKMLRTY